MKWVPPIMGGAVASSGEGKAVVFKSKLKLVGLVGLVLSTFSLFTHFLLARYTAGTALSEYQSSITIFSWRPIFDTADLSTTSALQRRLWGPIRPLESLHPYANPRGNYPAPVLQTNGFIFVKIRGGFHEIRNSSFLRFNPRQAARELEFKSFAYLYNEEQFISALAEDVKIVKTLPKNLKGSRRKKEVPSFKVTSKSSTHFYLHYVLPVLTRHSVVEIVVADGGCLQPILPQNLEEHQRLRCRVAFHALRLRDEVQELATKILYRLRASGRPFIAYDPGMTRDTLAYYGCAELFHDVHTELIQHKRAWMIKRGIVKGNLSVYSTEQRLNGLCPLMPEEVGIILRAYGYSWDTIIYISGGEVFGGQKKLIPLHAMFENVVDRTLLSMPWELNQMYGREANLVNKSPKTPPPAKGETKVEAWKTSGPRPRPLPPPPARPKTYNIEGWWGWVAESDNEPESTVMELRTNAHKLLWEAIDYTICVEADVFIPGFDRDGKGNPNFASLVMGHRLYQSAASKTYRFDRKDIVKLLEEIRDQFYQANHTWITSVRRHLRRNLVDGLTKENTRSKPLSFLSFPVPECSCSKIDLTKVSSRALSPSSNSRFPAALGAIHQCPSWMNGDMVSGTRGEESEEDLDEDDSSSTGLLFQQSSENNEGGVDTQIEDQEELDGGER